jgi:hypothetical protein
MNPARYTPTLPKFSGLGSSKEFIENFEIMATASFFPKDNWLSIMFSCLETTAAQYARLWRATRFQIGFAITGEPAYTEFISQLQSVFNSYEDLTLLEFAFRSRKQVKHESVLSYIFDLLSRMYTYDKDMTEADKIRYLLKNALPEFKQGSLLFTAKTVQDFITMMVTLETTKNITKITETDTQTCPTTNPTTATVVPEDTFITQPNHDVLIIPKKRRTRWCPKHRFCNHFGFNCEPRNHTTRAKSRKI